MVVLLVPDDEAELSGEEVLAGVVTDTVLADTVSVGEAELSVEEAPSGVVKESVLVCTISVDVSVVGKVEASVVVLEGSFFKINNEMCKYYVFEFFFIII